VRVLAGRLNRYGCAAGRISRRGLTIAQRGIVTSPVAAHNQARLKTNSFDAISGFSTGASINVSQVGYRSLRRRRQGIGAAVLRAGQRIANALITVHPERPVAAIQQLWEARLCWRRTRWRFRTPNVDPTSTSVGMITSTNQQPRNIQIGLRFMF
jgi:hypothetical protein